MTNLGIASYNGQGVSQDYKAAAAVNTDAKSALDHMNPASPEPGNAAQHQWRPSGHTSMFFGQQRLSPGAACQAGL